MNRLFNPIVVSGFSRSSRELVPGCGLINLVANEPCSSTSFPDFKLSDLSKGLKGRVGEGFIFNSYLVLDASHTIHQSSYPDFKLSVRDSVNSAEPGLRACVPVSVFSLPLGATTFDYLRRARTLTLMPTKCRRARGRGRLTASRSNPVHLHGVRTRYSYDIRPFAVSTLC